MPIFFFAEISAKSESPPQSSDSEVVLGQFLLDPVGGGVGLVDLVDGHDDGHAGRARVVDGLHGLFHDAVVGGHDEDDDVRHLGAAGAHGRKGLVSRRVQKDDVAVLDVDVVGADGLRDAAGLAVDDVGLADGIQQRRLAVVDVAHDGHNGRPGLQVPGLRLGALQHLVVLGRHGLHLVAELGGDEACGIDIDGLVDGDHRAQAEKLVDDVACAHAHLLGQLAHPDGLRDPDPPLARLGDRDLRLLHLDDGGLLVAPPAGGLLLLDLPEPSSLVLLVDDPA